MDHKEYVRLSFLYLTVEKNYGIVQKIQNYSSSLYAYPLLDASYFKKGLPVEPLQMRISSEKEFLSCVEKFPIKSILFRKDDLVGQFCFIDIFKKSDYFSQSCMLKNIEEWSGFSWKKNFIKLIESISVTKSEIVDNFFRIPSKDLDAKSVNIFKLHDFLIKKEFTEKELDSFYLRFFRERKEQLTDEKISGKYKDFLLARYGGDKIKLKPYADYMSSIVDEYDDIQINFNSLTQDHLNLYIKNFLIIREKSGMLEPIKGQPPLDGVGKKTKHPRIK